MLTQIKLFAPLVIALAAGCGTAHRSAETAAAESPATTIDPMFACAADVDCTAIEDDSACDVGVLVAVNVSHADGYCSTNAPAPDCSIAAADDTRVAYCDFGAHRCQMIAPTQIHCQGFINPNHACPTGFVCDFHGRVPDVGGTCVAQAK